MKQATAKLQTVMAGSTEETMVAFVTDPASREIIIKAAVARSWPEQAVRDGDIASAIQYTTDQAAPTIVMSGAAEPQLQVPAPRSHVSPPASPASPMTTYARPVPPLAL